MFILKTRLHIHGWPVKLRDNHAGLNCVNCVKPSLIWWHSVRRFDTVQIRAVIPANPVCVKTGLHIHSWLVKLRHNRASLNCVKTSQIESPNYRWFDIIAAKQVW